MGMFSNVFLKLKERGFIVQSTNETSLINILNNPISLYCGFDITADSLHIGHLLPLLCLKHFQKKGHVPVVLLGSATSLIGDPSFKNSERKLLSYDCVRMWKKNIIEQISLFLDFNCCKNSAIILDNYSWFNNINILDFLRNIGKFFSINTMINKEAIKNRIIRKQSGISYTEFSYNLLQSYDFLTLYKKYKVILQFGGSDQWGNISSGINLIHRIYKEKVFGFTIPLLIQSNGIKFGKTEKNTLWLDAKKTSPYKFYQFWLNISDVDIQRFLLFFTFLSSDRINKLCQNFQEVSSIISAKYILADSITALVHGRSGLSSAKRISKNLFQNSSDNMTELDFKQLKQDGISTISLTNNHHITLQSVLVLSLLVSSRSKARHLIKSNAIYINNKLQSDIDYTFSETDKLFGKYTILARGKKSHCLLCW